MLLSALFPLRADMPMSALGQKKTSPARGYRREQRVPVVGELNQAVIFLALW
jgi:hypothetical protein